MRCFTVLDISQPPFRRVITVNSPARAEAIARRLREDMASQRFIVVAGKARRFAVASAALREKAFETALRRKNDAEGASIPGAMEGWLVFMDPSGALIWYQATDRIATHQLRHATRCDGGVEMPTVGPGYYRVAVDERSTQLSAPARNIVAHEALRTLQAICARWSGS